MLWRHLQEQQTAREPKVDNADKGGLEMLSGGTKAMQAYVATAAAAGTLPTSALAASVLCT